MEAGSAPGELRRDAIGLPQVLFQAITHMAPGAAIAFSIFVSIQFAGPALPLSVRVWESHPKDELDSLLALPLHGPFGNDLLRLGYVKAFMDGTLGSQTARLLDGTGV